MGGVPELMIVLMYVLVIALLATVGYLVVKKAVKKAIIEAHDEIEARGKQGCRPGPRVIGLLVGDPHRHPS